MPGLTARASKSKVTTQTMNDDDTGDTPAQDVELEPDDADRALMTRPTRRHGDLDPLADLYSGVVGALAALGQHGDELEELVDDDRADDLVALRDDIQAHAINEYEDAVRWTIDPYDATNE